MITLQTQLNCFQSLVDQIILPLNLPQPSFLIFPEFGLGYAWQPALAEIRVGDMIRFQWTSPPFVTSNQFSVMEVASLDAEYDGTGFHSGDPSPTGKWIKLTVKLKTC